MKITKEGIIKVYHNGDVIADGFHIDGEHRPDTQEELRKLMVNRLRRAADRLEREP